MCVYCVQNISVDILNYNKSTCVIFVYIILFVHGNNYWSPSYRDYRDNQPYYRDNGIPIIAQA